jgi:hypothetical protein
VQPLRRSAPYADSGYQPGPYRAEPARRAPRGYAVRSPRADIRRRRQNVLFALVIAAVATAVGGFGLGVNALIGINLLVDALLVFYVYLLVQVRRAEEERAMRQVWSQAA